MGKKVSNFSIPKSNYAFDLTPEEVFPVDFAKNVLYPNEDISDFNRNEVPFLYGNNPYDRLAENQGTLTKGFNILGRGALTFLQAHPYLLPYQATTGLNDREGDFLNKGFDWIRDNWFPVYMTQEQQESGIGDQAYWGTRFLSDVTQGIGFLAASRSGAKLFNKLIGGNLASSIRNAKLGELASYSDEALLNSGQVTQETLDAIRRLQKFSNFTGGLASSTLARTGESVMESTDSYNTIVDGLKSARDRGENEYTDQQIKAIANKQADHVFGLNMALGTVDYIQNMRTLFKPAFNDLAEYASRRITGDAIEGYGFQALTKKEKIGRVLKEMGIQSGLEGGEELVQYGAQKAGQDIAHGIAGYNTNSFTDYLKQFGNIMPGAISSKEGMTATFLGALLGGGMSGLVTPGVIKTEEAYADDLAKKLNQTRISNQGIYDTKFYTQDKTTGEWTPKQELINSLSGFEKVEVNKVLAALNGDEKEYNRLHDLQLYNKVVGNIKFNRFDSFIEELNQAKEADDETLAMFTGKPLDKFNKEEAVNQIDETIGKAKDIKKVWDTINVDPVYSSLSDELKKELTFNVLQQRSNDELIHNTLQEINELKAKGAKNKEAQMETELLEENLSEEDKNKIREKYTSNIKVFNYLSSIDQKRAEHLIETQKNTVKENDAYRKRFLALSDPNYAKKQQEEIDAKLKQAKTNAKNVLLERSLKEKVDFAKTPEEVEFIKDYGNGVFKYIDRNGKIVDAVLTVAPVNQDENTRESTPTLFATYVNKNNVGGDVAVSDEFNLDNVATVNNKVDGFRTVNEYLDAQGRLAVRNEKIKLINQRNDILTSSLSGVQKKIDNINKEIELFEQWLEGEGVDDAEIKDSIEGLEEAKKKAQAEELLFQNKKTELLNKLQEVEAARNTNPDTLIETEKELTKFLNEVNDGISEAKSRVAIMDKVIRRAQNSYNKFQTLVRSNDPYVINTKGKTRERFKELINSNKGEKANYEALLNDLKFLKERNIQNLRQVQWELGTYSEGVEKAKAYLNRILTQRQVKELTEPEAAMLSKEEANRNLDDNQRPMRDIGYIPYQSAGSEMQTRTESGQVTNELTEDLSQRIFFDFTRTLRAKKMSEYKLEIIHKGNNVYGEEIAFHDDNDIKIVFVSSKSGKPIRRSGHLVYSSMHTPKTKDDLFYPSANKDTARQRYIDKSIEEAARYNVEQLGLKGEEYTEAYNKEYDRIFDKIYSDFSNLREEIKKYDGKIYTAITGKSKGVLLTVPRGDQRWGYSSVGRIFRDANDYLKLKHSTYNLKIVTTSTGEITHKDSITNESYTYKSRPGAIWMTGLDDIMIPLNTRPLTEDEANNAYNLIRFISLRPKDEFKIVGIGEDGKDLDTFKTATQQLKELVYWTPPLGEGVERKDNHLVIDTKNGVIEYGIDGTITFDEIKNGDISSDINLQNFKLFLAGRPHQVSNSKLNQEINVGVGDDRKYSYTEIIGFSESNKPIIRVSEYGDKFRAGYKQYLLGINNDGTYTDNPALQTNLQLIAEETVDGVKLDIPNRVNVYISFSQSIQFGSEAPAPNYNADLSEYSTADMLAQDTELFASILGTAQVETEPISEEVGLFDSLFSSREVEFPATQAENSNEIANNDLNARTAAILNITSTITEEDKNKKIEELAKKADALLSTGARRFLESRNQRVEEGEDAEIVDESNYETWLNTPQGQEYTRLNEEIEQLRETTSTPTVSSVPFNDTPSNDLNRLYNRNELPANVKDILKEVESVLGDKLDIDTVLGLIDGRAVGRVTQYSKVLISDLATLGTGYHEAFHYVSQFLLRNSELKDLYKEAKSILEGTTIEVEGNKYTVNASTSNRIIEEYLAEEFRVFMLNNGKVPEKLAVKRETLFSKIVKFIKGLIGLNEKEFNLVTKLYNSIKNGDYLNTQRKRASINYNLNRIKDLSVSDVRDMVSGINHSFFNELFSNKNSYSIYSLFGKDKDNVFENLYRTIYNGLKKALEVRYNQSLGKTVDLDQIPPAYRKVNREALLYTLENFSEIKLEHKKYLNSIDTQLVDSSELFIDENDNALFNVEEMENNKESYDLRSDQADLISPEERAASSVKLIIAGLRDYKGKDIKYNRLGFIDSIDYSKTLKFLQKQLQGMDFPEMINKLKQLASINPTYENLVNRLKLNTDNPVSSMLSKDDHNLHTAFQQQFSQVLYPDKILIQDDDRNNYLVDSNRIKASEIIRENWIAENYFSEYTKELEDGTVVLDKDKLSKINTGNYDGMVQYLKAIGINISDKDNSEVKSLVADHFTQIKSAVVSGKGDTILGKDSPVKSRVDAFLEHEASINEDITYLQYMSARNKNVFMITLPESMTVSLKKFNAKTLMPNNPYIARSFLQKNNVELKLVMLGGTKSVDEDGSILSDSTENDLAKTVFNSALYGVYLFPQNSDKRRVHGFNIKPIFNITSPDSEVNAIRTYKEAMFEYLKAAIEYSQLHKDRKLKNFDKNEGSRDDRNLGVFDSIITNPGLRVQLSLIIDNNSESSALEPLKEEVFKDIDAYIRRTQNDNIEYLTDNRIISKLENGYVNYGIDIQSAQKITGSKDLLTEPQIRRIINQVILNDTLVKFETLHAFMGDIRHFKSIDDAWKRVAGVVGTKAHLRNDTAFIDVLNRKYPRKDGKVRNGRAKVYLMEDTILSTDSNIINQYKKFIGDKAEGYNRGETTDAGGFISLDYWRDMLLSLDKWTNELEAIYNKQVNKEELTQEEYNQLVSSKEGATVYKPMYYGKREDVATFEPIYLKFSALPLLWDFVKGNEQLEKLFDNVFKHQIDITTFPTASKAETIEADKDQSMTKGFLEIDNSYFGIQVATPIKKSGDVTSGTQFRKIVTLNIFNNSIPVDFKGTKEEWNGLKEEEKSEKSPLYKQVKDFQEAMENLTNIEKDNLYQKLGLVKSNRNFFITDEGRKNISTLLLRELRRVNANDNLIASVNEVMKGVSYIEEGQSRNRMYFDATVAREKFESILFSIVDNNVVWQKMKGDMRIQVPPLYMNDLKPLRKSPNGVTLPAEIKTSITPEMWKYAKSIGGITKLNSNIKEVIDLVEQDKNLNEEQQRLWDAITVVGYRIPTQGLNSIEYLVVKEFLSPSLQGIVVTYPQIIRKSGTDYDVDKLSLMFRNVYTKGGNIYIADADEFAYKKYIQGILDSHEDKTLLEKFNKITDEQIKVSINKDVNEYKRLVDMTPDDSYAKGVYQSVYDKVKMIPDLVKEGIIVDYETFVDKYLAGELEVDNKYIKNANQNRYIDAALEILKNDSSFDKLILPNDVDELHEVEKEIASLTGDKSSSVKNNDAILSWVENVKTGHRLWSGKYNVGAAALNNTSHSLSQEAGIIVSDNMVKLPFQGFTKEVIDLSSLKDNQGKYYISELISKYISGFVDLAKDDVLSRLNMIRTTSGVIYYLTRAGVDLNQIFLLINQPIIKEFIKEKSFQDSLLGSNKLDSDIFTDILNKYNRLYKGTKFMPKNIDQSLYSKFKNRYSALPTVTDKDIQFSYDKYGVIANSTLKNGISKSLDIEYWRNQFVLLDYFMAFNEQAKQLTSVVQGFRQDSQRTKSQLAVDEAYNKYLSAVDNKMIGNTDNYQKTVLNSFITVLEDKTKMYTSAYIMSDPIIKDILDAIPLSSYGEDYIRASNKRRADMVTYIIQRLGIKTASPSTLLKGADTIAKRLREYKKQVNSDNTTMERLLTVFNTNKKGYDTVQFFNTNINTFEQNQIIATIEEIYNTNPKLGEDLIDAILYQSGFYYSGITLLNFLPVIPTQQRIRNAFERYLSMDDTTKTEFIHDFYKNFVKQNYKNRDIVYRAQGFSTYTANGERVVVKRYKNNIAKMPIKSPASNYRFITIKYKGEDPILLEKYKEIVEEERTFILFKRINTLGDGQYLNEVGNPGHSLIPSNNVVKEERETGLDKRIDEWNREKNDKDWKNNDNTSETPICTK